MKNSLQRLTLILTAFLFSAVVTADLAPFKSITYTWDTGAFAGGQYHLALKNKELHWEGLAGSEKGQSATEDVVVYVDLGGDRQLITWLEKVGYTVTIIVDTKTHRIDGVVSKEKEHYVLAGKVSKLESN